MRFRFGPFVLDARECTLTRDGKPIRMQPRVFDLLKYFVERPHRLVSREELTRDVWGGVCVADQALTQSLRKVRIALGDDVSAPRYLTTLPRRGYRFVQPVLVEEDEPPSPEPPSRPIPAAAPSGQELLPPPPPLDSFVGREADLEAVLDHFARGQRLVTLVGPVGVGKSRLAREVVARLGRPTVWVGLSEAIAPAGLHAAIERAAGAAVLVFDDADALLDEVVAAIPPWLAADPRRAVLVTTREGLRMAGEQIWPVRPLATGADDDDAVALFVSRARTVQPGWAPSAAEREDIRALVAALDGLPLAIELAAARVRSTSPADLLARLDEQLDWLESDRRDVPPRHRRLATAIESAWSTLTCAQQATLAQLAMFSGPFGIPDAERALDLTAWPEAPSPFAAVDSLFGKSLVVRASDAEAPYRLLRSVRTFAAGKLGTPGAIAVGGASWTGPERRDAVRARVASP